jgi:hypothetical protein
MATGIRITDTATDTVHIMGMDTDTPITDTVTGTIHATDMAFTVATGDGTGAAIGGAGTTECRTDLRPTKTQDLCSARPRRR